MDNSNQNFPRTILWIIQSYDFDIQTDILKLNGWTVSTEPYHVLTDLPQESTIYWPESTQYWSELNPNICYGIMT